MDCKCTFSQNMLGDGCDICNPELAAECAKDAENYKKPHCKDCGAMTSDEASKNCKFSLRNEHCHGSDLWL